MTIKRIAIIGGGLMGHSIAQALAYARHNVRITDPNVDARDHILDRVRANLDELGVDRSVLSHITVVDSLEACVSDADWVFEAAPEDLPLKQEIFAAIERAAPKNAILASSTSVIPITPIVQKVVRKERALGAHWWNPPYLVPLVEVVRTAATSDDAVADTMANARRRRQDASRGEEGCRRLYRQSSATRTVARGDRAGRRRRLRRQDGG
jgi:3-hydroxybutyryl-CoA dehydrogenase